MSLLIPTLAPSLADSAVPASARQPPRRVVSETGREHAMPWQSSRRRPLVSQTWLVLPVACSFAGRAGQRRVARCRRHNVALRAATAESMASVLSQGCPLIAKVAEVRASRAGDGLGLFAKESFEEGDEICELTFDNTTIMKPNPDVSSKLESGDIGALAFQVLKASRSPQPGPWKDWFETGVSPPDTHPLKLLLNDPQLAKYIWSSTTCGGQMSGLALQARDDLEQLQGSASFEDWTDTLALVMSRSVIEDREERPLLVMGLDLLQAAEDPVLKLELNYGKEGAVLGLGGRGPEKLLGIKVIALETIEVGTELTISYLPQPHAGGYLERYGFVPTWLQGTLAESAMQLSIAPVDDEDDFAGIKESCLEDLGLSDAPLSFTFSLSDGILAPREIDEWEKKSELEKMTHVLRFQTCGGTDSFLLDAVYVERFWYNCNFRISRNNEILVCQAAMAECDRWLERFDAIEAAGSRPDCDLAKAADDVRRAERELLVSVKLVFEQELDLIQIDDTIRYWADRAMDEAFPDRISKNVQGY
ncbi:[Fructose-bisphosphate aldolase]-lysine N-methyltransferase [Durusdinium trenchii]|uniref:Chloroplastic (Aldolases N-methyltransferase) ([Ribulose-bisphosphate carboxylase]-lysine N-methyltransferase-like) (AtLSMT-L) (LSMT-like enzyme) n=1 Tax=Durusdinium trenchii TaxID=1381693 RepID=A0ABP0LG23_9DINO